DPEAWSHMAARQKQGAHGLSPGRIDPPARPLRANDHLIVESSVNHTEDSRFHPIVRHCFGEQFVRQDNAFSMEVIMSLSVTVAVIAGVLILGPTEAIARGGGHGSGGGGHGGGSGGHSNGGVAAGFSGGHGVGFSGSHSGHTSGAVG